MAQRSQVIDITKSYLPGDPNSFVQNLVNTDKEDGEEKTLPVLPYEGYNFLPTAQGYKSYFGISTLLDIGTLSSRTQFILSYQLTNYQTRLIALCEDGIWMCNANVAASAWTHPVVFNLLTPSPFYDPAVFEEWTWCVIENVLYMYQQGRASAWKTSESGGVLSIVTHTPSFLNMTVQMGIFKAGLRLGFWDSSNSVSWSSNLDLTDLTPSLENLAGNTIFGDTIGRIITIKQHGPGFIVYCTKGVIGVKSDTTGNRLWDSNKIFDNTGISYSRAITYGQADTEHFCWATNGIYRIGKFNAITGKHEVEQIVPDVYDFLRESRDPIYLDTINSRFIFFHILHPDYVYGLTSFAYVTPPDLKVNFLIGGHPWDGEDLPAICMDGNAAAEAIRYLVTFGFESTVDTTALWIATASESQDGTIGPLSSGGGTRPAETPGFTTEDIVDSYISGSTLPAELDLDVFEHTNISEKYLGNKPPGSYDILDAMSSTLTEYIYKQKVDWELFRQHQTEAFVRIGAATKVTTTPGVTVVAYVASGDALPSVPASSYVDTPIGTYKTGRGNVELQLDKPLRKIVIRKYWQEGVLITKRVTTSYVNRLGTPVSGWDFTFSGTLTGVYGFNTYAPASYSINVTGRGLTKADALAVVIPLIYAQSPATAIINGTGPYPKDPTRTYASDGPTYTIISQEYIINPGFIYDSYAYYLALPWTSILVTPVYQDTVETVTYIIGDPATASLGSTDFSATQVEHARTIIQVTSNPPTIVVHSPIAIFPTGPSAITFFPPVWEGEETIKIIAASALSPWHYVDGTFGIALIGDAITDSEDQLTSLGGCDLYGDHFIPTDFGVTYSSFPYTLQIGSPNVVYPAFTGSLVFDLALKKWGKQKNVFQILVDLQPVNQFNHNLFIARDDGMDAALYLTDDSIKIFDDGPADSRLTYGKIGYYRLGMTTILEVKAAQRRPSTGILTIDSSLDGRSIDASLQYSQSYGSSVYWLGLPDISARWHVVTVSGNYDLTGLEVRAVIASRR